MSKLRKNYTADEKAKIALEALSGQLTGAQLTSKYGVHSSQINSWKKRLKSEIGNIFKDHRKRDELDKDQLIQTLYQQIGQLKVEIDWLKKKAELFN